ncbi:unnamed protein product [Vitrella brassicaformis CCMP3155]|uniref:Core Histone H2A/H2B/H3 domain-containing protein n=1 Tax=Vitrella brassicaformis (strain CCMP3155) TaxID=1169540 RepID=A0A0G4FNA0_VITBC|nr:unnamed protein product [Vitrella brassicaformis CCMP3155]|mmetsp:Transcript_7377/g.18033  ORF Transcript_7377/g.18033 Transcript_7377/m.18033 type:complete len:148 (-) Transcript_7377:101-544(-)|eukprot:CEM15052.1 unnamed protein product [Vitrella brassicaformis CCMP3155]
MARTRKSRSGSARASTGGSRRGGGRDEGEQQQRGTSARRRDSPEGRKKIRHRPGFRALREIRKYQKSTDLLIPKLPFARLVKETTYKLFGEHFRWSVEALQCVQTAAEAHLTGIFADAQLCSFHAKRVTLMLNDIRLARRLRGDGKF